MVLQQACREHTLYLILIDKHLKKLGLVQKPDMVYIDQGLVLQHYKMNSQRNEYLFVETLTVQFRKNVYSKSYLPFTFFVTYIVSNMNIWHQNYEYFLDLSRIK